MINVREITAAQLEAMSDAEFVALCDRLDHATTEVDLADFVALSDRVARVCRAKALPTLADDVERFIVEVLLPRLELADRETLALEAMLANSDGVS